ncbi:hypothetical protein LJR028_004339 [Rhizobacter sp. LjRoot28]
MFSYFKRKLRSDELPNLLFMFNMHVGRGTNTDMPANLAGAYVCVYAAGPNYEAALSEAVARAAALGYRFIDLTDGKAHQLDPHRWTSYLQDAWPEFEAHFPTQDELLQDLPSRRVFFGPFVGYEANGA